MVHLQRVGRPVSARRLPRPPTLPFAELAHQDRHRWRASQAGGHECKMPEASYELGGEFGNSLSALGLISRCFAPACLPDVQRRGQLLSQLTLALSQPGR